MSKDARKKSTNKTAPAWGKSRIVRITSTEQLRKAIPDIEPFEIEDGVDAWWVLGLECGGMGPYMSRSEARESLKGVEQFYRDYPWTIDEPKEKAPATKQRCSNRNKQLSFLT